MVTTNRINALRQQFQQLHIDSFIVTNSFNLLYLVGFDGLPGDGCLVVTATGQTMITDDRYKVELEQSLPKDIELRITRNYYDVANNVLKAAGGQQIGIETSVSLALAHQLKSKLAGQLVETTNIIEAMRRSKDADEIAALRKATQLANQAFSELIQQVSVGQTELEVANWLNNWMLTHGAQKPSFDTIVASGYRSALPHGFATTKPLEKGDMVTVDFGYYVDGYTSDMTRTFALGDPGDELRHVYDVVHEAQERMFKVIKPGNNGKVIDAAGRDYIGEMGFGDYFKHGSGHGIGLDIHETPNFGPSYESNVIHENYVMTVEPGIYLPGKGGVRIEDDLLVTQEGNERLTSAPRTLQVI